MATRKHIRTTILTISSIAITVTGAWYGLGLKTQHEIKEEISKKREAKPADLIAQLEKEKTQLMAKKIGFEMKIAELVARQEGKKAFASEDLHSSGREQSQQTENGRA